MINSNWLLLDMTLTVLMTSLTLGFIVDTRSAITPYFVSIFGALAMLCFMLFLWMLSIINHSNHQAEDKKEEINGHS